MLKPSCFTVENGTKVLHELRTITTTNGFFFSLASSLAGLDVVAVASMIFGLVVGLDVAHYLTDCFIDVALDYTDQVAHRCCGDVGGWMRGAGVW